MKKLLFTIGVLGILNACSNSPKNNIAFEVIENDKTQKLNDEYSELFKKEKFNGAILIAEKGVIIYEKAFGIANEEKNTKIDIDTKFELASVSKQFTAMGIVQLKKKGLLDYKDKISKYIPELAIYNRGITIEQLLVHSGGLSDYMELALENWDKSKIATNDDIIKLFEEHKPPILFRPNERFEYSNTGYMLLGTIIERVSGKDFETFLAENIFKPADMSNSFVYRRRFSPKKIDNYAEGYLFSDSLNRKVLPDNIASESYVVYLDGIVGDGMVNSNLRDLLKWDRILYTNKLIGENDKKEIFSSYVTSDSLPTDYGFGWEIDSLNAYGKIASHSGGWAGYVAHIERHLDNDKTIILLQNNLTEKTEIPLKNTRKILYNIPIEKPIILNPAVLKTYAGIYLTEAGNEIELAYANGELLYALQPGVNLPLIPVSKTKFILDGLTPEVTYTFKLDDQKKVESVRIQQPEQGIDRTIVKKK